MKKIIKIKRYDLDGNYEDTLYIKRNGSRYVLNNDGSVHWADAPEDFTGEEALMVPAYEHDAGDFNFCKTQLLEIEGKFGLYDFNMSPLGKLYNSINEFIRDNKE